MKILGSFPRMCAENGTSATVAQLRQVLEDYAEEGASISAGYVIYIFGQVGKPSVEDLEALLSSARKGARKQYNSGHYFDMTDYDKLSHFLENQLELATAEVDAALKAAVIPAAT